MSDLIGLGNIGQALARRLDAVGVHTVSDLDRLGHLEAYLRLRDAFPRETPREAIYVLAAARWAVRDIDLPADIREDLRQTAERAEGAA